MTALRVVIAETLDDEPAAWLAGEVDVVRLDEGNDLRSALVDADGLIVRTYTRVDRELLAAAPKLRVVGRAGVGVDNIDLGACRDRGVRVVYTPDANTTAVVEYVWALVLDAFRPRPLLEAAATDADFHRLRRTGVGRELRGRTIGILGMGRIGRRVARVAEAFGMNVVWNDLLDRRALGLPDDLGTEVAKDDLWPAADVLTIHVDGRPSNRRIVDADVLDRLSPTCLLVNTARGMLVDPAALAAWARRVAPDGGAAVLDVHDPEPPAADSPLRGLDNVRLHPHLAARTGPALRNMSWVVRDVLRVLRGEAPEREALSPPGRGA